MGKLFTHTHILAASSVNCWSNGSDALPYGWEGNRGSGVAVVMRHGLVLYPPPDSMA